MEKLVQFVRQLFPENQQWAVRLYALRVAPDGFNDLSFIDPHLRRRCVLIVAEIQDRLRQFVSTFGVEIGAQDDRAVEGSGFLPSAARHSGAAQNVITPFLMSMTTPAAEHRNMRNWTR